MALKIRLRKQGRTNRPFYRLVLTNALSPRDGKYIETLGWLNPFEEETEKKLSLKADRIKYWFEQGAQLSENAASLVKKGAPEVMKEIHQALVARKAKKVAKRRQRKKAQAAN